MKNVVVPDQPLVDSFVALRSIIARPPEEMALLNIVLLAALLPVASSEETINHGLWVIPSIDIELQFCLLFLLNLLLDLLLGLFWLWSNLRQFFSQILMPYCNIFFLSVHSIDIHFEFFNAPSTQFAIHFLLFFMSSKPEFLSYFLLNLLILDGFLFISLCSHLF